MKKITFTILAFLFITVSIIGMIVFIIPDIMLTLCNDLFNKALKDINDAY